MIAYLKIALVFLFSFFILFTGFAQQRVHYTQYMFNGLAINPAYAGVDEALSLTFLNRSQWRGLDGAPVTQTFSGHTLFKNKHVGVGLTVINDKVGVHKNLSGVGIFAYHLRVANKSYLSMGFQGGASNRKSDYVSLAGSATDPKIYDGGFSQTFVDFGVGAYFRSPHFEMGFSMPQIIQQNVSVNDTLSIPFGGRNYFIFSKLKLQLNDNLDFEPGLLIKYLPGLPVSYDINANLIISKALTLGLSYRANESISFLIKGQITNQFQVGYAYDHVISNVRYIAGNSHEVMVNYLFKFSQRKVASPR